MNARRNKLITPGILMVFSAVIYIVSLIIYTYYINVYFYNEGSFFKLIILFLDDWIISTLLVAGLLVVGLYCLILYNKKSGRIIYYIGFALLALEGVIDFIFYSLFPFRAYTFFSLLITAAYIIMIVAKAKPSRAVCVVCITVIGGSILFKIFDFLTAGHLLPNYPYYIVYLFALFAGLIVLWWSEIGNIYLRKRNTVKSYHRINPISNTYSIEVELKTLKDSYDLGLINESEYNEKKLSLLEKL